jgi:Fe-Mn family superoxide dismutase
MERTIAPLPYAKDALEPYVTGLTVEVHYERHHRGYLKKLVELVEGKPEEQEPLEALIRSASGEIFENAAQVWNHDFFWRSLRPGGSRPGGDLLAAIERDFGGVAELEKRLVHTAESHFGSGWLWLALDFRHRLRVVSTHDADSPLRQGGAPLLCVDLWEHAYYLDYFNERKHYAENVVRHLLDWDFAAENLRRAPQPLDEAVSAEPEVDAGEVDPSWQDRRVAAGRDRLIEVPIRSALWRGTDLEAGRNTR